MGQRGSLVGLRGSVSSRHTSSSGGAWSQATKPKSRIRRRFASRSTTPPPVASTASGNSPASSASVRSSQSRNDRLSLLGKDRGDRSAAPRLDLEVGVAEGPAESIGDDLADRRFSAASVADQGQPPAGCVGKDGHLRSFVAQRRELELEHFVHHVTGGVLPRVELELDRRLANKHVDAGNRLAAAFAASLIIIVFSG